MKRAGWIFQPDVKRPRRRKSPDRDGLHRRPNRPGANWFYGVRAADGKWHEVSTRTANYEEAKDIRNRAMAGPQWQKLSPDNRRDDVSLKGFRFHDTRHTFRSDLADHDVDEETAMALMGHRSPESMAVYRHERKAARERKDRLKAEAVALIGKKQPSSGDPESGAAAAAGDRRV